MKLLKFIADALNSMLNVVGAILGVGFILALLTGFITVGCSKSWFYEQTACTINMLFKTPR